MNVFVVGLPSTLRLRLIAQAELHQAALSFSLTAPDRSGQWVFVPFEGQVAYDLAAFSDIHAWDTIHVVVLPYVKCGQRVLDALDVLQTAGARVSYLKAGIEGLPEEIKEGAEAHDPINQLFLAIGQRLNWEARADPVARFRAIARRNKHYIIFDGALDNCHEAPVYRHCFLNNTADLLEKFLKKRGVLGKTLEAFFKEKNIDFCKSGGIETTLTLQQCGRRVSGPHDSKIHVKDGDRTTPQAAVRVYFQYLEYGQAFYLFLFHAGSHPDRNIRRDFHVDELG